MQRTTCTIGRYPYQVSYQQQEKIFQDQWKQFFTGHFIKDRKEVIVKRLKYQIGKILSYYPTFDRQMKLRTQISHPNLMGFYYYFIDENYHVYIVTEKAQSKLVDLITEKKISREQKLKYAYQIIKVMNYLHHGNDRYIYQHRNLKPSSIYLDKGDNIKLSGLNLIKKVERTFDKISQTQVGAPLYNCPEILRGQKYSAKCDVWSAGCLLYQICTGQQLFNEAKTISQLKSLIEQYQPKLKSKLKGEDQFLKQIIINKMIVNEDKRASFEQILYEFNKNHQQFEHPKRNIMILSDIRQKKSNQELKNFERLRQNSNPIPYVRKASNNPKIIFRIRPGQQLFREKPTQQKNIITYEYPSTKRKIGQYIFDQNKCLGNGSFGIVYEGYIEINPQYKIAVKVFNKIFEDISKNEDFCRQQKALTELEHDNILKLIDFQAVPLKKIFLITEKCDESLRNKINGPKIPQKQIFTYCLEIIQAFEYMNKKCYIHRDLKPENILLKNRHIKISDFGLAKNIGMNQLSRQQIETNCGTLFYQSPQQLYGQSYNYKCDVWAFGCIIYEMLTGSRLFSNIQDLSNIMQVNSFHLNKINYNLSSGYNPFWRQILPQIVCYDQNGRKSFQQLGKIFNKKAFLFM